MSSKSDKLMLGEGKNLRMEERNKGVKTQSLSSQRVSPSKGDKGTMNYTRRQPKMSSKCETLTTEP